MYRNLSVVIMLLFISTTAIGQFSPGTRMVGASVAGVSVHSGTIDQDVANIGSTTGKTTGFDIRITPALGWFISDNTAVGVSFNLNPAGSKISYMENGSTFQSDKSRNFNIGIGGFARNYFTSKGAVLPFGQFSLDAGIANSKTEGFFYGGTGSSVYKETYSGNSSGGFFTNAILTAGVTKMLGKHIGLDLYAGYNFHYSKNSSKTTILHDDGIDGSIDETRINETDTKLTDHRFIFGLSFQVFLEKGKSK